MSGLNVVIGAGVGGLSAALALRRRGLAVRVFEARSGPGGLAASFEVGGRRHDGGPYILLDRPGLAWAFERLGLRLEEEVGLIDLEEPWRVERPDGPTIAVYRDLGRTADGIEREYPGGGDRYRRFVGTMAARFARLAPLQRQAHRGPLGLLGGGRWRDVRFLLRSLGAELEATGLPGPVRDVLGIWTHIAAQPLDIAPAPLALVPAIVHTVGAFTVRGGMGRIVEALARAAERAGVEFSYGARVDRVVRDGDRVLGVEVGGQRVAAERVFSDAPGITTLAGLVSPPDRALAARVQALPLQSPGVAAWLHVDGSPDLPFLRFRLVPGQGCRALLYPGAVDKERAGTARLLAPVDHGWAERVGVGGQEAWLDGLLSEPWWREGLGGLQVVERRVPVQWGRQFHLWRDSMNPTMTAQFMRQGRLPHRSPLAKNLFLCGSSTHPGQWVSFCAISGILAVAAAGLS